MNKQIADNSSEGVQVKVIHTAISSRPRMTRIIRSFRLVWLNESMDEENDDDCRNTIAKLRQINNTVDTFVDVDECIDFITDMNQEVSSMIVSGKISEVIVPIVQEISQVNSVYILCSNNAQHLHLVEKYSKVKYVCKDISSICESLKEAAQEYDRNSTSISFVKPTEETSKQNLDTLDQSFMYTQILKDIILNIDFDQSHINDFLVYCREQLVDNPLQLADIDRIEKQYNKHQPIWWYTYDTLLYSVLNRALRLMEVDLIIKIGFFVRDLHQHIVQLHAKQFSKQHNSNSFLVYRGQGLSMIDFDKLKNTQGGLISFNNFLSTSLDRKVSVAFAESNTYNSNLIGILFEMKIDPSISITPFANIKDVGYFEGNEEEILFSMHSVFRIERLQTIDGNSRLWQVNVSLTSDNDPELHALTGVIQKETQDSTGWYRLGKLMLKLGHSDKAEELYGMFLKDTNDENDKAYLFHHFAYAKHEQGRYSEAIEYYKKATEIWQNILPSNHPDLATSYNNIGWLYRDMGEHSKAISYYEKVIGMQQKTLPVNHPSLATSYNNIGEAYTAMGEYSTALSYYEKAIEMQQKTLPVNHPSLAISYNNIGLMYYTMEEYSRVLPYYEKALEIRQKTLPANHPDLGNSYKGIGLVYIYIGEYSKVIWYLQLAVDILKHSLPKSRSEVEIMEEIIEAARLRL